MKGIVIKTGLVFGLVMVLLSTNIAPGLLGRSSDSVQQKSVDALFIPTPEKTSVFSLNVFGTTGLKKHDVALSADDATLIFDKLKELKSEMTQHLYSEKTQSLKIAFVDLLDEKGIIPNGVSKEAYLSLLNPRWVERLQKTGNTASFPQPFANRGTCALCSLGGEGSGILLPLFLLPRPRIAMLWLGTGLTTAANLLTSKGYVAEGAQTGFAFGFMGIGISYALPGYTLYGFIGYALLTSTTAEYVEHYPPNRAPEISDNQPANGEQNVPLSLSELQFRIQDADGDLMSYSVTTEPDIGSGHGNLKPFGLYTVPISGLAIDKIYRWTVEVTDGAETTTATYGFFTEGKPPFDPFTQGWNYRKKITIDHNQVTGDLTNFPILISITDQDLRDKAQNDGDDILFMDSSGVATKLYHEIEYFDSSTGMLTAWVNIPIVHSTEDTSLYMYYGNPSINNQQFSEKTWDSHYQAVWHMNDATQSTISDSTINGYIGTKKAVNEPIATRTQIYNGQRFDGLNDYIQMASTIIGTGVKSWSFWANTTMTAPSGGFAGLLGNALNGGGTDKGFCSAIGGTWPDMNFEIGNTVTAGHFLTIGIDIPDSNLHYYTAVYDGTDLKAYRDGSYVAMDNTKDGTEAAGDYNFMVGRSNIGGGSYYFYGTLDEIRVSNIAKSANWISTEYVSQNDPTGFLFIGSEEPGP